MLAEQLLKTIQDERAREIATAQRIRSATVPADDRREGRSWLRHLWAPTPTFGGRPHPGKATTESSL